MEDFETAAPRELVPTGISNDSAPGLAVRERVVSATEIHQAYLEELAKAALAGDDNAEAKLTSIFERSVAEGGYN